MIKKNENLFYNALKKKMTFSFWARPLRGKLERALDILYHTDSGKELFTTISKAPSIFVKRLNHSTASYYKKEILLDTWALFTKKEEEIASYLGHELFHQMDEERGLLMRKKGLSLEQYMTLSLFSEARAEAFEETLKMEINQKKGKDVFDTHDTWERLFKTDLNRKKSISYTRKHTQSFIIRSLMHTNVTMQQRDWLIPYLFDSYMKALLAFGRNPKVNLSDQGNKKAYDSQIRRAISYYRPFLKPSDIDSKVLDSEEDIYSYRQRLSQKIKELREGKRKVIMENNRPKVVLATPEIPVNPKDLSR